MKRLFSFLVAFTFFLQSFPAISAVFNPSDQFYTIKTAHFFIHYPHGVESVAQNASEIAETVYSKLSTKLDWKPWGRTHMVLVDQTDTANGMATVIPANYLLLFVTPPKAGTSLDNYKNYLDMLITHELTHILHIDQHHKFANPFHWLFGKIVAPNGLTPGWMREGMAAWEESVETGRGRGNSSYSDMLLRASIYDNNFPAIDQAAGLQKHWPGSDSQYIYGVKFWQWISKKYGEETIAQYMKKYSSGLWLFSLNNKAKKVWGKSFYVLWKEWQDDLRIQYAKTKSDLTEKGLTSFNTFIDNESVLKTMTPQPSGIGYAYLEESIDEGGRIVLFTQTGNPPTLIKRLSEGQMAFSKDSGSVLAYSSTSGVEPYTAYDEVFLYDLLTKKTTRAYEKADPRQSLRATDPDFAPFDGGKRWLVMVRTQLGTSNLYAYDILEKKGYYLTNAPAYTEFANPRFSPDGEKIAVSRHDPNGNRDIVLYTKTGDEIKKITDDAANDHTPVWSPDGRCVYYTSDSNGISNIYRYDTYSAQVTQITNVLTGVFEPQISPDGKKLYASYYTSHGTHLAWMEVPEVPAPPPAPAVTPNSDSTTGQSVSLLNYGEELDQKVTPAPSFNVPNSFGMNEQSLPHAQQEQAAQAEPQPTQQKTEGSSNTTETKTTAPIPPSTYTSYLQSKQPPALDAVNLTGAKKYNAFPQVLVPRYIVPTFSTLDSAFLFGFSTGRFDPLYRHSWNLYTNYRTDASFLGGGVNYAYTRYNPAFFAGAARYALNWGDIFGTGDDFFEDRVQGYVGTSFTFRQLPNQSFSLNYFFETRDNLTDIPAGYTLPNLAHYAGLHFQYLFSRTKFFPESISPENGFFGKLAFDITDSALGSDDLNEQRILTGDVRYYFEMPWSNHHVLGVRAAGGFAWGDPQFAGSFRLGGPFGEGNLAGYSDRLFPLRGLPGITFEGDRALLFSAEYRLPIADVERGIGTLPIFLNKIHAAFFTDYGDIWFKGDKDNQGFFDSFLLGAGAELQGDFVIGYGLPVTARLGYAVILANRDRIVGLSDSFTGIPLTSGTFYLQFGTSF